MFLLTRYVRSLSMIAAGGVLLVSAAACGGENDTDSEDSSSASPSATGESPTEESTPSPSAEPSADESDSDIPGGVLTVGDKSVFLDGFIGVRLPDGWSVTSAEVPLLSSSGSKETDLDPDALAQALVLNPEASPRGATFSLLHYEHSDAVPDLNRFDTAMAKLLSAAGDQVAKGSQVTIGKQPGMLHQVKSVSGTNGVLVTLRAGEEYFAILSLNEDTAYAEDNGQILSSISFVPEALHS